MSIQALATMSKIRVGSARDKSVLLALANYADQTGMASPSIETISRITELSESAITHAIEALEKGNFIKSIPAIGHDNQSSVYNYYLQIPTQKTKPVHKTQPNNQPSYSMTQGFKKFWKTYPSRRPHSNPKTPALSKFITAIQKIIKEQKMFENDAIEYLLNCTRNFAKYIATHNKDPKYIPLATTWLNQQQYFEFITEAVEKELTKNDIVG